MKKFAKYALSLISILVLSYIGIAQGPPQLPPDTVDTPIDGGLGVLLAAGVGYGVKKYRDQRNSTRKKV